jgi:hypothetical protein
MMLMVGASTTWSPSASASRPMAAATCSAVAGFQVAASATPTGKTVAGTPLMERTPVGPSVMFSAGMPIRSTACSENELAPASSRTFSPSDRRAIRPSTRSSSAAWASLTGSRRAGG